MLTRPSSEEWAAAVAAGFTSNGATSSPDTILGILIANGNTCYPPLPADLHDYRYWVGGDEAARRAADDEFLVELYACVDHLPFLKRQVARRRCRVYHRAVCLVGGRFWNYRGTTSTH
jgi:hypothetical protein